VVGFLAFLGTAAGVAAIAVGLVWLGRRVRRRGVGGEVMGPFEEIWHPAAYRARMELEVPRGADGADAVT
jgi:hypothetical protein